MSTSTRRKVQTTITTISQSRESRKMEDSKALQDSSGENKMSIDPSSANNEENSVTNSSTESMEIDKEENNNDFAASDEESKEQPKEGGEQITEQDGANQSSQEGKISVKCEDTDMQESTTEGTTIDRPKETEKPVSSKRKSPSLSENNNKDDADKQDDNSTSSSVTGRPLKKHHYHDQSS